MRPWLFKFGEIGLPSYYTLLMLGFLAATILGWRECRRTGLDAGLFLDMCILIVIAGVFGARLMHVLAEEMPHDFFYSPSLHKGAASAAELVKKGATDVEKIAGRGEPIIKFYASFPAQIFYIWKGGMAFYGGLILATISAVAFMAVRRMNVLKHSDIIGFGLPLGLVFGRIGCFLNGCCFGVENHGCMGVHFPQGSAAFAELRNAGVVTSKDLFTPPLLPAMLYEGAACLAMFLFLYFYIRPRKKFDGQIIFLFGMAYPARFALEYLRNDNRGVYFGGLLSSSQLVSVAVFMFSAVMYYTLARKAGIRGASTDAPNPV
jgi:phosphatidylglycerol---prolipoprotein diacylglyceryl transferase